MKRFESPLGKLRTFATWAVVPMVLGIAAYFALAAIFALIGMLTGISP